MKPFFSRLSYSFGNEDWRTEREALQIQPDNRVVCITASGDRVLHLLMDPCREIVAVDLNPTQNHLLNLKMAALAHFDYEKYLAFLGAAPSKNRLELLSLLTPYLPPHSATFWHTHRRMIEKGILYQGAVERIAKLMAKCLGVFRRQKIAQLFQFNDVAAQKLFVEKQWDTYYWRKIVELALHPKFSRLWMKDPGLYEYLGQSIDPGKYIYNRMNDYLCRYLAKESLLLSFLFLGKVGKEAMPPYLTEPGTRVIRSHLDRVSIRNEDIVKFLENEPDNSYDRFSISDVASYISESNFQRMIKSIYRTARPGARFCLRQFLSHQTIPEQWQDKLCRDPALEKRLEQEDRMFVYRFLVGTVNK